MKENHAVYNLDELADMPLLKKMGWTKRKMINAIQMGFLEGVHDSNQGCYLCSLQNVRDAIALRNEALRRRMVDPEDL